MLQFIKLYVYIIKQQLSTHVSQVNNMTTTKFDSFLQRVFEATGITSQTELASALNINRSAITQARKKDSIPDKWILQLYRSFGLNPDWVETGSGQKFHKHSDSNDSIFNNIPKVRARFRKDWLRTKGAINKMVLMDIFGNSMEPEMKDGDTILIDESQKDILAGAIYAVGVDDTIMVKRLEKHPNKLVLLSDNKQGGEIDSVRIIGKVIWICRELR
jgi:phage repressor protein C with HTH and peptisase S24 domain